MSRVAILGLPDFGKPFVLETNACATGIGAMLMQEGRPLAFLSRALGPKHVGLSIYEKEFLVVLMAMDKWRHYFEGGRFIIKTDHENLKFLLQQKFHTQLQKKGMSKLMVLDYVIQYRKGKDNMAVNALSRCHEVGEVAALISTVIPEWCKEIIDSYEGNAKIKQVLERVATGNTGEDGYSLSGGVLRYHGRIVVGDDDDLKKRILRSLHESALGGHSGAQNTYLRLKQLFYWSGLKTEVKKFVMAYEVCKRCKSETVAYPRLLQPLAIPNQAWENISMNFIEGLPKSEGRDSILVVVDKFTKFAYFIGLTRPFIAQDVARVFLAQLVKVHGTPKTIISN